MKVVIIGSGNVATVLGKKIFASGHDIIEVVSRSLSNAQELANVLQAKPIINLKEVYPEADLYLLCVGDGLINEVANNIPFNNKLIVHSAGAVSKDVLSSNQQYGVLYPLQSIRKEMDVLPEIPVLVDGNTKETAQTIYDFAKSWATSVSFSNDESRLKLHLAAVFASNFTNHLYAVTEQFCQNENVDFRLLFPLIKETAIRLQYLLPSKLQTGPAVRNDASTMDKHIETLSKYPDMQALYKQLSNSIIKHHNQKKTT